MTKNRVSGQETEIGSTTAVHASGASYRRLDHWTRQGYLRPSQARQSSGVWREWPVGELQIARLMVRLIAVGFTPERASEIGRRIVDEENDDRVPDVMVALGDGMILVLGNLS